MKHQKRKGKYFYNLTYLLLLCNNGWGARYQEKELLPPESSFLSLYATKVKFIAAVLG